MGDKRGARQQFKEGLRLVESGRLREAAAAFEEAARLDPDFVEGWVALGTARAELDDFPAAFAAFARAKAIAPDHPAVLWGLGLAHLGHGDTEQGIALLERAVPALPQDAGLYVSLAGAYDLAGDLERAGETLRKAVALDPALASARLNLGIVLVQQGKADEAELELRQAAALDPSRDAAHTALGGLYLCREEWRRAAACFRKALRANPDNAAAHGGLGQALAFMGQPDKALREAERAEALCPNDPEMLCGMGAIYLALGKVDEAKRVYHRAAEIDPENPLSRIGLAQVAMTQGEAGAFAEQFAALVSAHPEAASGLAEAAGLVPPAKPTRPRKRAPASRPPAGDASAIYQLKISLRGLRPPVWRRVLVAGDVTLDRLHEIIQAVMGWTDSHLHQFSVGKIFYADPEFELDARDEARMTLGRAVPGEKSRFSYEYDFGDGWEHEILVEKILPREEGRRCPVCIAGKRACPPDDVGGVWGYVEFLAAIGDPKHPEHETMLEWIGGEFDPERFDIDEVNQRLARLRGRR